MEIQTWVKKIDGEMENVVQWRMWYGHDSELDIVTD